MCLHIQLPVIRPASSKITGLAPDPVYLRHDGEFRCGKQPVSFEQRYRKNQLVRKPGVDVGRSVDHPGVADPAHKMKVHVPRPDRLWAPIPKQAASRRQQPGFPSSGQTRHSYTSPFTSLGSILPQRAVLGKYPAKSGPPGVPARLRPPAWQSQYMPSNRV